ncbi:hypothetical protein Pint_21589 [Pistacia integerrima]|uniref:Uncharacterized protein n=1 Tax=Pistacia integerrima TaxID=434235 RepID=A0ACC0XCP3_9ROSI|nr:hypothetical protein Pint_21589 [Pistacia integerrima]
MVEPEDLIHDYWPFESRKSTVKNMWDALKDVNTSMMGVSGMGGVGKNTFVKGVGRQAMEDLFVEEVVFAEVTETPDVKAGQPDLADKLAVERFKKGKKILLILDNTWEDLDLKTVGIPSGAWSLFGQTAGN